jgi:hypothetical protein
MARFSKTLRQKIIEEFAKRHGGRYDAAQFLDEVQATGPEHAAYAWFEWDQDKAATQFRIEQAREFARDLRVTFTIEEVTVGRSVKISRTMPLALSPLSGRAAGGGYVVADQANPVPHMAEHCHQGAVTLRAWYSRYGSAMSHAGADRGALEGIISALENVTAEAPAVAA